MKHWAKDLSKYLIKENKTEISLWKDGPYYTSAKKCKLKQDPTTYLLEWCFKKKKQTKKYTQQQKIEVMSKAHKKPPEKVASCQR